MDKDILWSWEPPLVFRASPEEITTLKERFKAIVDCVGGTRSSVAKQLFEYAMDKAENDPEFAGKAISGNPSIGARYWGTIKSRGDVKRLEAILEDDFDNIAEDFVAWCEDQGIPARQYEKALRSYNGNTVPAWKEHMVRWLNSGLLCDYKPHETEAIKDAARADGILVEAYDWTRLRRVASELGWTTDQRGWWRKPESEGGDDQGVD
jgi:hypothetical protein